MAEHSAITFKNTGGKIRSTITATSLEGAEGQRANAFYTGQISPFLKKQYSIFILDAKTNKVIQDPNFIGLNPAATLAPPEYFFGVAPKVIEVSEPFATTIIPTQRGGKYVESHGSIIKSIRIQGTTGVRPNRSRGPASNIPLIGEAVNDLTGEFDLRLPGPRGGLRPFRASSEETGFDSIVFLRNIFRAYSDVKENDETSNHILMVWRNNKDGDSWIVEPKEFRINRSAASPLTYEYNISFQTLSPLNITFETEDDPLSAVLEARKVFERVQEFNQSLRRTFLIVSTQVRRLEGLGVFAQTQLLNPIINVTRGLGVLRATGSNFGKRLQHNARVLSAELDNAIDLLSGTPGVEEQDALVRSLRRASITAARILVEPGTRENVDSEGGERQDRYARAYITSGNTADRVRVAPAVGGSKAYIGNAASTNSVAQGTVHVGEDIRALAGRLLGDRSQWHIIVTLNGLKSPYLATDGRVDTLAPGMNILYPVSSSGVSSMSLNTVNVSEDETDGTNQNTLGPVQQAYGRDIRLVSVPTSASGVDLADVGVNQKGDLASVTGVPNVEQGIIIKFSTERGELPAHPGFGASFPIGSKATPEAINDFRSATESTIYSDGRVQRIDRLDFLVEGDTLLAQSRIVLIDSSDNLNITFPLRRV